MSEIYGSDEEYETGFVNILDNDKMSEIQKKRKERSKSENFTYEDNDYSDKHLKKIAREVALSFDKDVQTVKVERATAQCGGCGGLARLVLIDGNSDWWCDGEQSQCAPIFLPEKDEINNHPPTPLTKAVKEIVTEYKKAAIKFPVFNSRHEGYAVIEEELDELWAEVKKKTSKPPTNGPYNPSGYQDEKKLREEAIQVAAMSLRFIIDVA